MRPATEPEPTRIPSSRPVSHATSILPVAAIKAGRRRFSEQASDLAADIIKRGLVKPIGVVVNGSDYVVVYGERRFAAVKKLGWTEVPAQVLGQDKEKHDLDL